MRQTIKRFAEVNSHRANHIARVNSWFQLSIILINAVWQLYFFLNPESNFDRVMSKNSYNWLQNALSNTLENTLERDVRMLTGR